MKKITVWALLLALTVALFAGCSNTAPAETEAPATEAPVVAEPAPANNGIGSLILGIVIGAAAAVVFFLLKKKK